MMVIVIIIIIIININITTITFTIITTIITRLSKPQLGASHRSSICMTAFQLQICRFTFGIVSCSHLKLYILQAQSGHVGECCKIRSRGFLQLSVLGQGQPCQCLLEALTPLVCIWNKFPLRQIPCNKRHSATADMSHHALFYGAPGMNTGLLSA